MMLLVTVDNLLLSLLLDLYSVFCFDEFEKKDVPRAERYFEVFSHLRTFDLMLN